MTASAAQSSDAALERKKARRQQLLAAAFGDQPPPPRWSDLSPAQRCFADGLTLAFSFLSLFELIRAARACRSWRQAAIKADVPGESLFALVKDGWAAGRLDGSSRLRSLVSSPFRRHVHELNHDEDFETPGAGHPLSPKWTLADLALVQHLPQLQYLTGFRVELTSALPDQALSFPPLIESADFCFSFDPALLDEIDADRDTAPVQRLVLEALRPCRLLMELRIYLHPLTALCLDGLPELSALQTLTIDVELASEDETSECTLTEAHMGAIKQLPRLRDLYLREGDKLRPIEEDFFGTRWLRWLCPLPHRLQQLHQLDLSQHYLHLEHMLLLQRLPALTSLTPAGINETALPLLPAFASRLLRLECTFVFWDDVEEFGPGLVDEETGFARAPLFLPHLIPCTALTRLTLRECVFSEADATALCQALTQLRDLDLDDVSWPSFESLRHLPLLQVFRLRREETASHPLTLDVAHFKPLQQLRDFCLLTFFPLSDADQSVIDALGPPSALLPALDRVCILDLPVP